MGGGGGGGGGSGMRMGRMGRMGGMSGDKSKLPPVPTSFGNAFTRFPTFTPDVSRQPTPGPTFVLTPRPTPTASVSVTNVIRSVITLSFNAGEDRDLTPAEYELLRQQLENFYSDSFSSDPAFNGINVVLGANTYRPGE